MLGDTSVFRSSLFRRKNLPKKKHSYHKLSEMEDERHYLATPRHNVACTKVSITPDCMTFTSCVCFPLPLPAPLPTPFTLTFTIMTVGIFREQRVRQVPGTASMASWKRCRHAGGEPARVGNCPGRDLACVRAWHQ